MKLTPLEISQHTFRKVFRGYHMEDVRTFLEGVAKQHEDLVYENKRLKREFEQSQLALDELKKNEELLRQTLISTEKMSQSIKAEAEVNAKLIIANAEIEAESLVKRANLQRLQMITEMDELKKEKERFFIELRNLLRTHEDILTSLHCIDDKGKPLKEKKGEAFKIEQVSPTLGTKAVFSKS